MKCYTDPSTSPRIWCSLFAHWKWRNIKRFRDVALFHLEHKKVDTISFLGISWRHQRRQKQVVTKTTSSLKSSSSSTLERCCPRTEGYVNTFPNVSPWGHRNVDLAPTSRFVWNKSEIHKLKISCYHSSPVVVWLITIAGKLAWLSAKTAKRSFAEHSIRWPIRYPVTFTSITNCHSVWGILYWAQNFMS